MSFRDFEFQTANKSFKIEVCEFARCHERILAFRKAHQTQDLLRFADEAVYLSDGVDSRAWHWVVSHAQKVVAVARLSVHHELTGLPQSAAGQLLPKDTPLPLGWMGRRLVHPDLRGQGIGSFLVKNRVAFARELNLASVVGAPSQSGTRSMSEFISHGFSRVGVGDGTLAEGGWVSGTGEVWLLTLKSQTDLTIH